jgi:hypothetical protein
MGRRGGGRAGAVLLLAALVLGLAGCSDDPGPLTATSSGADQTPPSGAVQTPPPTSSSGSSKGASTSPTDGPGSALPTTFAVPDPGRLRQPLLTADVLVTSTRPIPSAVRQRVRHVRGVRAALAMSVASVSTNGRTLTVAGGDPGQFRRFTGWQTAQSQAVWSRVAGGEIAVDPSLPPRLVDRSGYLRLGATQDAPRVHVGAYAPLVRQISGFVNRKRARQLGMPTDNALLVSTGTVTPSAVRAVLRKVVGSRATLQILALEFDVGTPRTAVLSGSSVTSRVGTFSYTPHPNGTVSPDPAWVHRYIRTETVPILGTVTCNKGMLPQLRAALGEVVASGLAAQIHPGEYGGCYYPRFISYDPAKGLSLHSWGIAVDLNVPGNQRGTVGQMDRRVVAIFKKWGFAWGGDWNYTDPMHFEMAKVVDVGGG